MAQDIQVLGKRNENDKLSDINLTRSICLNDLTQEQLARLYKKGVMTFSDFFSGCKLFYYCQYRGKTILLNVERVMFDSANQTVVFECGYSMVHDKYFRVLLNKDADGQYLLSPRISDVPWLTSDELKTVNGQSLVGTGDIEIAAGNKVYELTDMNVDERIALYNALKDRTITLMNSTIAYYNNAAGEEAIMTSMVMNDTDGAIFSFLYKGKIFGLNLKSDGTYEIIRTWEE